jgi:hypothetical protein
MNESQPVTVEGEAESPPEFDRVADVLGPLEQIVQAADQRLGSIQKQVSAQAGETHVEVERRVREAAVEQRRQVAELRQALTERVSELAGRFDSLLSILDEADRSLAIASGEPAAGDVRVTVTERQRLEISHEQPPAEAAATPQGAPPSAASAGEAPEPRKEKGIRRFFRRPSKRSSA